MSESRKTIELMDLGPEPGLDDLPPELKPAPLWAQMMFVENRRLQHRNNNLAQQVVGAVQFVQEAYDELTAAIGQAGDGNGLGAHGLAGEVAAIRRDIGCEPQDGRDGRGILGRLHRHDRHRETWDNRWRDARAMAVSSSFFIAILGFLLKDKLLELFGAK